MELQVWLAFVAATLPLLIMPGPTVLLVMTYAVQGGRNATLAMVAGVALGHLTAMSASLAGVGTLLLSSPQAFTLLKAAAVIYLVHLGLRLLRTPLNPSFPASASPVLSDTVSAGAVPAGAVPASGVPTGAIPTDAAAFSCRRVFLDMALVTALNPKSISFFIAIVPIFVNPTGPMTLQFAVLVSTFVSLAAVNTFSYSLLARRLGRRAAMQSLLPKLAKLGGSSLLLIAVLTASQGFLFP